MYVYLANSGIDFKEIHVAEDEEIKVVWQIPSWMKNNEEVLSISLRGERD